MHVRVVRFTDATRERVDALVARIEGGERPPGLAITGLQLLFDESQGTAIAIQAFASDEDMRAGDETLRARDAGETPGTRVSVDMCELLLERRLDS